MKHAQRFFRRLSPYQRVRQSVLYSLKVAAAFSVYVIVLSLLRRSFVWTEYGMNTAQIVAAYFAAAILAGSVVGLIWPLTQWQAGAGLVGAVAGTLVYGAIGVTMGKSGTLWVIAPILGVIGGGGLGMVWWSDANPHRVNRDRTSTLVFLVVGGLILIGAVLWYPRH